MFFTVDKSTPPLSRGTHCIRLRFCLSRMYYLVCVAPLEQVQNIEEEIKFYTQGLGMKVVRQREVNGARNVFVSYGEESLRAKDGGRCDETVGTVIPGKQKQKTFVS